MGVGGGGGSLKNAEYLQWGCAVWWLTLYGLKTGDTPAFPW